MGANGQTRVREAIAEAATTQDGISSGALWILRRECRWIFDVAVATPLPHTAEDVLEPQRIGLERCDRRRECEAVAEWKQRVTDAQGRCIVKRWNGSWADFELYRPWLPNPELVAYHWSAPNGDGVWK